MRTIEQIKSRLHYFNHTKKIIEFQKLEARVDKRRELMESQQGKIDNKTEEK
jgi:hypothetical protein